MDNPFIIKVKTATKARVALTEAEHELVQDMDLRAAMGAPF